MSGKTSEMERESRWHKRCIKAFFGTNTMPVLDLTEEGLVQLASRMTGKGLTVPGVQKKLSLHLSQDPDCRLTIVDYPTGYILKPQTSEYPYLPEFEDLVMRQAKIAGIRTVPNALIRVGSENAYITRRVDRQIGQGQVQMYAMEDFCQLSGRMTEDKYKGSYERCSDLITQYSMHPA
jgi:serine/threonine-protein kinase HipA